MEFIQIILEIILIILGLYLALFKSYFQEKGKNLATFEDIEEITEKVESIKTDFIRETEKLKLDLQYTNQVRFSIKTEEMKSLFDYYEKYYLWLNILLEFYFGVFDEDNPELLKNSENVINDANFKLILAEAKAELLIDNAALFTHSHKMKVQTLQFQHFINTSIQEFKKIQFEIKSMKATTPIAEQLIPYKELSDKMIEFNSKFNDQKLLHYKEILPMNKEFRKIMNELLITINQTEAGHEN
jgi:hypothetical protein